MVVQLPYSVVQMQCTGSIRLYLPGNTSLDFASACSKASFLADRHFRSAFNTLTFSALSSVY